MIWLSALLLLAEPAAANGQYPWRQLTSTVNAYAVFSPDGRTIVYQSNATGNWDLLAMNADGTNTRRLTDHPAADITPIYSPDGKHITFCSERDGNREVYVMNADGTEQRRLTQDAGNDLHPAFSSDGSLIIFSSNRGNKSPDDYDIYVMNRDGTAVRQITDGPEVDTYASFSPDGKQIITRRVIDGGNNEVFIMNADGSAALNLTNDPQAYDGWPVWSPNGRWIAFASGTPGQGNHHIYLMKPDGSARTQMTGLFPGRRHAYYTQPSFSPDGSKLLCTMYNPASQRESSEIILIDIAGHG